MPSAGTVEGRAELQTGSVEDVPLLPPFEDVVLVFVEITGGARDVGWAATVACAVGTGIGGCIGIG